MMRLRLQFSKGEAIRYIAHLDLARAFERSIRRAELPIAMSEGFNPHIKVAYASALSVGVTSACEYIDLELRKEMPVEKVVESLRQQLPHGLEIIAHRAISCSATALMAVVNLAEYTIRTPLLRPVNDGRLEECLQRFWAEEDLFFVRQSPKKGKRTINLHPLVDDISLTEWEDDRAIFYLRTLITDKGTIKPQEVMQVLSSRFESALDSKNALVHRIGLYILHDGQRRSPLEIAE